MKCKTCNGLGRTKATEFVGVDEGLRDVVILCPTCGGKGEIELTEQEYIQTCNTEQLADVLFSWYKLGRLDVINKHTEVKKDWLIGWLKQPNTDKE